MSGPSSDVRSNRVERIIAYVVAGVVGLSIIAFLAVIIGTATGMRSADFTVGAWPVVIIFPLIGLPIGFVLIITLLVASSVRRSREARQGRE